MVESPSTCGEGLAQQASLPAKVGELMGGMAAVVEHHMTALELRADAPEPEHALYRRLGLQLREVEQTLRTIADEMAGARDLPMGRHDERVMKAAEAVTRFEDFVRAEDELYQVLEEHRAADQSMLTDMRAAASSPDG